MESEWRRQELQRDQALARKRRDVNALEKKLKQALFDLEKQDATLRLKESELKQRQSLFHKHLHEAKDEGGPTYYLFHPPNVLSDICSHLIHYTFV